MSGKYDFLKFDIVKHFGNHNSPTKIARLISDDYDAIDIESLRKHISRLKHENDLDDVITPYLDGDANNVLIIGDLHTPFNLKEYLLFCRIQQEKFKCGRVIFIGDLVDNHFSSYHESDPDGLSAGDELDLAINEIQKYYKVFPEADVIIGNHDRLVYRKAFSGGVSKRWIKEYKDVLGTPNWNFVENVEIFDININHGEGGTARAKMKKELQSQIQGHLHSDFYVEYIVGKNFRIFGMQVGCGIDHKTYAMEYGKNFKKPAIGCGVLLNKGTLPMVIPMLL
jgi:metallophosphoesterase superfamily enzyme